MAISCARCGRQYDVTLFEFGRTVSCACGELVGLEHKINLAASEELRFFADVNVARLVRWLRAVGLDTVWEDRIADRDLVRRAIEERRYILTLDKRILREFRADNILLLKNEKPFEQFKEVVRHFKIAKPGEFFTRCLVCNGRLRPAGAEEIADGAPAALQESDERFYFCPRCRKIYWKGSHTRRMQAALENVFGQ